MVTRAMNRHAAARLESCLVIVLAGISGQERCFHEAADWLDEEDECTPLAAILGRKLKRHS